jgi:deoxyhypusine synthase
VWKRWEKEGRRFFPYEPFYEIIRTGVLDGSMQIDRKDSWLVAACDKRLPIWTPGWEDSTLGNVFVANVLRGNISSFQTLKNGCEQMAALISWYQEMTSSASLGFFQVGGGISGDFPICVVPLIEQDLRKEVRKWGYFCQISESATSYGAYSGAVPNEKITWGKLDIDTPSFVIESDATIVFPLVAAYVLEQ